MFTKYAVPALAVVGSVAGQCTQPTATINAAADATGLASCQVFKGKLVVNSGVTGILDMSGISQIDGDLVVQNNGLLQSISSTTLNAISGALVMTNVTGLSSINFPSLATVNNITLRSLNALDSVSFGAFGANSVKIVEISDTFLSSLSGIDPPSVAKLNINNNRRLSSVNSNLRNLSDILIVQANGPGLKFNIDQASWIANMSIANVSSFSARSLAVVNGSARFDSNLFTSFTAPNLTQTQSGDISFIGNSQLNNVSFPKLTQIGGGLLIANNTALESLDGFQQLKTVFGAVKLRGSFKDIAFPALSNVRGAFDASSTTNISSSCDTIQKLAPSKQGGGGQIQGTFSCTSNNQNANSDTNGTTTGGSTNAASGNHHVNNALFGLALVGGIVALL